MDLHFGVVANKLTISKSGELTLFSFNSPLSLKQLSKISKNIPSMQVTSASRVVKSRDQNWKIEGQLAHIRTKPVKGKSE